MKVLMVSPCDLPVPAVKGGAVATLIESLVIQNETYKQMDLTVISSSDGQAKEKSKAYQHSDFIFLKTPKFLEYVDSFMDGVIQKIKNTTESKQYIRKLYVIYQIRKILKNNSYDRIVFQNSGYLINALRDKKILKKYKNRLYYHLHNDIPDNVYIPGVLACDLILISQYLTKKVYNLCGSSAKDRIHIVKNGFNCDYFMQTLNTKEKEALKQSLGISSDKKVILFAGRIVEYKGVVELLDAFMELNRDDCILMIVGSHNFGSGETSEFEKKVKSSFSHLGDKVIFTGFVPYDEMWKYYKLADAAVFPSMWEEPAGLVMIEAAAAGIPVITTRSGGIPEYLNHELAIFVERDANIITNLKNAILEVLNNQKIWEIHAAKASVFVKNNFSEEIFYQNFVQALIKKNL